MQIDLNFEELNLLVELLRRDYQELREEIYKTEDYRFKTGLRAKEKLIESLLQKVEPVGAARAR